MRTAAIVPSIFGQKIKYMKHLIFIPLILITVSACTQAYEAPSSLKEENASIVGYYSSVQPSHCRTNPNDDRCLAYYKEPACLQITEQGKKQYNVEAHVIDTRGFSCTFVGTASFSKEGLTAFPREPVEDGQYLSIRNDGSHIILREDKPREFNGYCGAHVSLDGIEFSSKDREPVRNPGSCAKP